MFTGLIREVGQVVSVRRSSSSHNIRYRAPLCSSLVREGDSIAVDGVCQTVTQIGGGGFSAVAVEATLTKTTLAEFRPGRVVNLEPSLRLSDSLDGHIVQGHVSGTGIVQRIIRSGESRFLTVHVPVSLLGDCRPEGSVALNGVSLTIARMGKDSLDINIIPETWTLTNLSRLRRGDRINIETDILHRGKGTMEKHSFNRESETGLTQEVLRSWGY